MSSAREVLSADEMNALIEGVDSGAVGTEKSQAPTGEVRLFDFSANDGTVSSRLPALDDINEKFLRSLTAQFTSLLGRPPLIEMATLESHRWSEYSASLKVPTALVKLRATPLHGMALLVLEPILVVAVVDAFFGGDGKLRQMAMSRDFGGAELRLIERVANKICSDLTAAWTTIMPLQFESAGCESNPTNLATVGAHEEVLVLNFALSLDEQTTAIQLVFPKTMLAPIMPRLGAAVLDDSKDRDAQWQKQMRQQIRGAELEVSCVLAEARMRIGEVRALRPGDVIPIELKSTVAMFVEQQPMFVGEFGLAANGHGAIKISTVLSGLNQSDTVH